MFQIARFLSKRSTNLSQTFFSTQKSSLKTYLLTGQSSSPAAVKATFNSTKATHEFGAPLEILVYSLISCENVTLRTIAKEQKVKFGTINYKRAEAFYDTKGFFGLDPNNKFSKVELDIEIETDGSEEKMNEILRLAKGRCPVYNMLHLAGVEIISNVTFKKI